MTEIICHNADNCKIYQNWIEQTKDNRLEVIYYRSSGKYQCLVLDALFDAETGIPKDAELTERLKSEKPECSIIELLNNSIKS